MTTQLFIALLCLLFPLLAHSQCSCEYCPCQGASSCPVYWPNHQWLSFCQVDAPCGVSGSFQVYSTALFPPDSFTVLAMNISSYEAFVSGEPYSTYGAWSSYTSVSCFDSTYVSTTDPGFAVVVSCENSVFQCRVIYNADWEANINCGNTTLHTVKHRRQTAQQHQSVMIPAGSKIALIKTEKGVHRELGRYTRQAPIASETRTQFTPVYLKGHKSVIIRHWPLVPSVMPRGRSPWTKELDQKFVQAIKDELGPREDVVEHSETMLPWEKILARLKDTWPEGIDTIKALKQRWDNAFRVWYAKAGMLDNQDEDEKRDYVLESRPGRRKSLTPSRKRKNDNEEEDESDDEKGKAEEEAGATEESDSSSSHQVTSQKKIRAEHIQEPLTDRRLRPWLVFLETPELAKSFRIQSHSGIVIEPKVILDGILGNGNNVSASDIVSLVKTIAPSEWFNRICNIADTQSIRKLLTQKMSFFLFPSKEVSLDGQRFMFTFVSYPASVNQEPQKPCMWSFLQDMNQGQSSNAMSEMLKTLDITNLFPREEFKLVDIALKAKLPFALLTLASFQECLRQSTSPVLNQATFSFDDQVKKKLLAAILYPPYVTIHSAPYVEPMPLPFKSMYDAVDSLPGIQVPPWCKDIAKDKRASQVAALFAAFKVKLLIADLRKKEQHLIHKKDPSEIEVALLVENKDHFGVVFRIKKTAENQALLSLLAPTSSLQDLKINNNSVALDNVNHQVDLNGPVRIDLTLADDVKISLSY